MRHSAIIPGKTAVSNKPNSYYNYYCSILISVIKIPIKTKNVFLIKFSNKQT